MGNIIIDNTDKVLAALSSQIAKGLEQVGMQAETYAKQLAPVVSGNLRNSVTHTVDGDKVYIGSNMEYAPYVEMGTGVYATSGGRRTPWVYADSSGNFYTTTGQKAQPFLKPAAEDHGDDYLRILKDALSK